MASLALYGKVFGDWSRYEEVGRTVLDAYLSPVYYHEKMGLFERGDKANFVERTNDYDIILDMLEIVHDATGDERLPETLAGMDLSELDNPEFMETVNAPPFPNE